jgi:hypothetical protein
MSMTPKSHLSIAIRVALAENPNMSLDDAEEFLSIPEDAEPYQSLEVFVQACYDDAPDDAKMITFNLSDVRILYLHLLHQWIEAGRPDVNDPTTQIKPLSNTQIISELKKYGLTYIPQGTKNPPPRLISQPAPAPDPTPRDRRSRGLIR